MADRDLPPHQPNCLGCGPENPAGMGVKLRVEGERIRGAVTLDRRHEGAPGYAHGGAIATVLDDALGSLLHVFQTPAVTARLELNYRSPALIDRPFTIEAWIEREEGRKLHLAGELRDEGAVVADARALFLTVEAEHFARGARRAAPGGDGPADLPW